MVTFGAFAGTLIGVLLALIIYGVILAIAFLSAWGIYCAGRGLYKKVQNDTYNKTFDIYREYSNIIFNYIALINEDDNFNIHNPKYKQIQQELYKMSGVSVLIADKHLHLAINKLIEQAFNLSTDQNVENMANITKKKYLTQLLSLQKAMRDHLVMTKPQFSHNFRN